MLDSAKARTPGTRATKDKVIRIMKRDAKGQGDHYYVYDLPPNVVQNLSIIPGQILQSTTDDELGLSTTGATGSEESSHRRCTVCNVDLSDVAALAEHFRSESHRQTRLAQSKAATGLEKDFGTLVSVKDADPDDESSESDLELHEQEEESIAEDSSNLEKGSSRLDGSKDIATSAPGMTFKGASHTLYSYFWFNSPDLGENRAIGIYRVLFTSEEKLSDSALLHAVRSKQRGFVKSKLTQHQISQDEEAGPRPPLKYFCCMVGGGYFAGMVVEPSHEAGKRASSQPWNVICHKTFHRYTTRRQQGGAQASNDAAKGAAHSAGSSLRRYNEDALRTEIRSLLSTWRNHIQTSELLFIRAAKGRSRQTLFGPYDGQAIRSDDERLRNFPFTTKRATYIELTRAFSEVTTVLNISRYDLEEKMETTSTKGTNTPYEKNSTSETQTAALKCETSKATSEKSFSISHLTSLIRRIKAPAVLALIREHSLPADYVFLSDHKRQQQRSTTLLQYAAAENSTAVVSALLVEAGANPTLRNSDGRTAYQLASSNATQYAFRVARYQLGEDTWDWGAAEVADPMARDDAHKLLAAESLKPEPISTTSPAPTEREDAVASARAADGVKEQASSRNVSRLSIKQQDRKDGVNRDMSIDVSRRLEREKRLKAIEKRLKSPQP